MRDKYTVTPLNPAMQTQCDLKYGSFCPRVPPQLYGLHRSSVMGQGETKQLFNIIQSGDVQPNPGPVKNPCRVCKRAVARTHRSLRCCSCFYDVHIKCAKVSAQTFTHNNEYYTPWTCPACDISAHNFTDSFFSTAESDFYDSSISEISTNSSDSDFVSVNHLRHVRISYTKNFLATYLNINSLRNKISDVKDIIQRNRFHVCC